MNAANEIEQYIKDQRQAKLLDVAKHMLAAMVGSPEYDGTFEEYAVSAVNVSEVLIKEVESR